MMDKLAKAQKNWMSKLVLILTALSFMSLFGVSGYLTGAARNKPGIKVDDIRISQQQFSALFEQEQQMARSLFGDNLQITDEIRTAMLQGLVRRELTTAIMGGTADKLNMHISDNLVRKIIYSQAEFLDANGNFSLERLRRVLSASGWTEQRYIDALKKDIVKQQLVQNPSVNMNVPKVLADGLAKVESQKKTFKYIVVDPAKVKIDRKITPEETEQYYEDFSTNFIEPEKRDVSFIVLSIDDMAKKVVPEEADIEAYYEENIGQFETPETRKILQMVFDSREDADKAMTELKSGKDFYAVAQETAGQDKETTDLGYVAKDLLIADMAEDVFAIRKGEIAGPAKSDLGWHIMKVTDIKAGSKADKAEARRKIVETLKKERAYDEAYTVSAEIEDKIGGGATLEDIAGEMDVRNLKVKGLGEDGKYAKAPAAHTEVLKSTEFVDTAFSYNVGEISQVTETDDGFVIVRVDQIADAHPIPMEKVKGEIEKMWEVNERSAIAQEIVNDVMHDLENGYKIDEVVQRFGLTVKNTKPLLRRGSFEGLSQDSMVELFQEGLGKPKLISLGEEKIIAVADKVTDAGEKPSEAVIDGVKRRARIDLSQDAAASLVNSFGEDYDVRVKYRLIGLAD